MLERKEVAVELWKKGVDSLYQDAAGGIDVQVFLFYASLKLNDVGLKVEVIKKIKKLTKSRRGVGWPGVLGVFILNEMDMETLLSSTATIPVLRERHLCQAYFVIALKEFEKGNVEEFDSYFRRCVSMGPLAYLEQMYYMAMGELDR